MSNPIEDFESALREEYGEAALWSEEERENAVAVDDFASYTLEDMLMYYSEALNYFSELPEWYEVENVFSSSVSVYQIAVWTVSQYCLEESEYYAELLENGF